MADADDTHTEPVTAIINGAEKFGLSKTETQSAAAELLGVNYDYNSIEETLHEYLSREGAKSPVEILREILATSERGIEADSKYWNDIPEIHLDESIATEGFSMTFSDVTSNDELAVLLDKKVETIKLVLNDSNRGIKVTTAFEYPDTELGTNNYAALVHAVNERLIDPFGLEYTMLKTEGRRWMFFLIDSDRLSALQRSYGEQIHLPQFEKPILEEATLDEYLDDPIPTRHGEIPSGDLNNDAVGAALVSENTVQSEPDPVTVDSTEQDQGMTGGVLNLEAINESTVQQPEEGEVNIDEDVISVIDEAEKMLEDSSTTESIFNNDTEKQEEDEQVDKEKKEHTDDREDSKGIVESVLSRFKSFR